MQSEEVAIKCWPLIGDHSDSSHKHSCVRSQFLVTQAVKESVKYTGTQAYTSRATMMMFFMAVGSGPVVQPAADSSYIGV
jgi:hypothetical protein